MRPYLLLLAVLAAVFLPVGCASNVVEVPKEVKVQVPVPCINQADRPRRPAFARREDLLAMPQYERTIAAWADLRAAEKYIAEQEAVIEGCSRLAP